MKALKSWIAWQGPSWRLRVEQAALPDGTVQERARVEHPGSVALVPLVGNEIVLLRQARWSLEETIVELPAGTRGWDEAWLDCAQRELREETGYRAAGFTPLGEIWPAPGVSDELMKLYLATGLTPDPLTPDPDETIELEQRPLAELVTMALDGRLRDAKSVVGVLRAAACLQRDA